MMDNRFRLLKADVQIELENLGRLKEEIEVLVKALQMPPSNIEFRAMGCAEHKMTQSRIAHWFRAFGYTKET